MPSGNSKYIRFYIRVTYSNSSKNFYYSINFKQNLKAVYNFKNIVDGNNVIILDIHVSSFG